MGEFWSSSHTAGGNGSYLEGLFESYLEDPASVPEDWKNYFDSLPSNPSGTDTSHAKVIERFRNYKSKAPSSVKPINEKQIRVLQLIQSYRNRGHMKSSLDPLNLQEHVQCDDLTLEYHGLNQEDLGSIFQTDTLNIGKDSAPLSEIIQSLERIYCNTLGIEYNYITSEVERKWFQSRLEPGVGKNKFSNEERIYILKRLGAADGLAKFLASRYPGMKRFGIEGAESLIPLIDSLVQNTGIFGAQQICFGMAHRGRLNLLVNVLGKSPKDLFIEFEEGYELSLIHI